jgi:hypothetical protein
MKIISCGLSLEIWYGDMNSPLDDFNRESSLSNGKIALLPNLALSPI